ncbi:hypothetical protein BKA67DRAFT_387749 [Truncatella angustata]|uniref:Uncharacterized protein n=1 Tax=Truncatella angustata TaxID=152316 RepID=A0A9P8RK01_9PEZI|nr:uncharacterized protein BKA67DRAFT_387749 [Truncatella angustata]KAH6647470.1 hypothetical protein BKA67DRAFT_387749 [Truncatella angustata]KAH8205405.1 hypothetical protein TruAng_000484 [Truncatella angustata]
MLFSTLLPLFLSTTFPLPSGAATPVPPGLTHLFTANVSIEPAIDIGVGPYGQREAIPIIGGTFSGPRINGTILNLGADWGWTDTHDPSGASTFHPDTRYQLRTSDGANIFIQTEGPAQTDGKIHLREKFETGSAKYYWLNNVVAVGILTAGNGYVVIDTWQINSPAA